ncbi:MAG: hypothetical protein JNK04_16830, partial [Myxococcales bacterium]|nr:hypothetical protein [Myxococcales bacterium]
MLGKHWLAAFLLVGCADPSRPSAPTDDALATTASTPSALPASSLSGAVPTPALDRNAALALHVTVEKDAWAVKAQGMPGSGSCAVIKDLSKLKACALDLKKGFPDETA